MKSLKLFQPFEKGINTVLFYAPKDESFNKKLVQHLDLLQQENYINHWDPSQLDPGSDVDRVLAEKVKKAEIIIFLVSADFLSSPEGKAMSLLAANKKKDFAKIVFVLVRPCLYPDAYNAQIVLPPKALPVSKWNDEDEAYTEIAVQLRKIARGIQEDKAYQQQLKNNPPPVRKGFVVSWSAIAFVIFIALKFITPAEIMSWFNKSNSEVVGVPYTFEKPQSKIDLTPLNRLRLQPDTILLEPGQPHYFQNTQKVDQPKTFRFKLQGKLSIGTEKVTLTPAGAPAQTFDFKTGNEVQVSQVFPSGQIEVLFQSPFRQNRLQVLFAD